MPGRGDCQKPVQAGSERWALGPAGVGRPPPEALSGLFLACASSHLAEPCSDGTKDHPQATTSRKVSRSPRRGLQQCEGTGPLELSAGALKGAGM